MANDEGGLLSTRTLVTLAIGITAGFLFARNQREVVRATVKGGLAAGQKIREIAEEVTEDIEDTVAEVQSETVQ